MNNKKKQFKKLPRFKNEDEERDFWAAHSVVDYFDMSKAIVNPTFPNLKFFAKSISPRLPLSILDSIKILANKRDVPYQSFIKMILAERIEKEQAR